MSRAVRGEGEAEGAEAAEVDDEEAGSDGGELTQERYAAMGAAEQFILTASAERLRQALVVLRVPGDRPRRQGHRRHGGERAQRPAGRLLPGRRGRRDHAGHRRRPGDPHACPRYSHHRPRHPGRDPVRRRRGRESGLGRTP